MILSPSYSRVAVRPFPLTEEMKQIVAEATGGFQRAIEGILDRSFEASQFYVYANDNLKVGNRVISLVIFIKISGNLDEFEGGINPSGESVSIFIVCSRKMIEDYSSQLGLLYRHFQITLNHELVHLMDPKLWSSDIKGKIPAYSSPSSGGSYESYVKHPLEKSAFEGSHYYYFHDLASRGIPLKKAVGYYTKGTFNQSYRDIIKKDGQRGWQEYLTRVYKSAEQAYQDVAQESKTGS